MLRAVAVGDSVVWGQGLEHADKFVSLSYREITGEVLPKEAILARSGAVIQLTDEHYSEPDPATETNDRNLQNEIPYKKPTVRKQVESLEDPDTIDLLFLDGGANDIDLSFIGNPLSSQEEIENRLELRCYKPLKELLTLARANCPNAIIVVTGYYPAITGDTPISELAATAAGALGGGLFGFLVGVGAGGVGVTVGAAGAVIGVGTAERIRHNVLFFHRRSLYWIRRAVAEINAEKSTPGPRVFFAHAGYRHQNGIYARDPWVYAPGNQDARRSDREPICGQLYQSDPIGREICTNASMLHPNRAGARAYAQQIVERYEEGRTRSLRDRLDAVSPTSTISCRDSIRRYNLPLGTGLQNCLDHFVVDTIQVTVETGDNGTDSDVYFRVSDSDQWLLDRVFFDDPSGSNDFEANTTASYTIDPILDGQKESLRLSDIKEISLIKQGPFDWKPTHITVELNGITVYDSEIGKTLRGNDEWSGSYPRDLLIREIQADAPGVPEDTHLLDEYVIIANAGHQDRDLTGYSLNYSDGQRYHFPDGYILKSGHDVTVRTGIGEDTATDLYARYRHAVLNNTGDIVTLRNASSEVIARKAYGTAV